MLCATIRFTLGVDPCESEMTSANETKYLTRTPNTLLRCVLPELMRVEIGCQPRAFKVMVRELPIHH